MFGTNTRGKNETYSASENSDGEDSVEREIVVEEESDHRSESHSNVVGKSVIAKAFATAFGWHNVDDDSVATNGDDAEH